MKRAGKLLTLLSMVCVIFLFFSCRQEEEGNPQIEKIAFEKNEKIMVENDTVKMEVFAEPAEAKKYDKIKYWVSDSTLLQILPESDNNNVVFKGLKAGKGIIAASVNGITVYMDVKVVSSEGTVIPYIVVSDYVLVSEVGEDYHISASLIGGRPGDESGFEWNYTGKSENVINLMANGGAALVNSLNPGEGVITVSHSKATFSVNTIVFVKERGETPVYISTDKNVINMNVGDDVKEYAVDLHGKNTGSNLSNENYLFQHQLINEFGEALASSPVIELRKSNNIGTIRPKSKGVAKVRVSHPDAAYPIEIIVVVNDIIEFKYIDIEDTVVIMDEGNFHIIDAKIEGNVPDDCNDWFVFENQNPGVVSLSHSTGSNQAVLRAQGKGTSVITVKNKYVDFDKEILVIVNGKDQIISIDKYITTNQNVITTEVNGEATLTMMLVGGNSADANGFIWTVDDGSIVEVRNQHGKVKYNHNARYMIGPDEERFEAMALVRALKIGTTTITLEHPKSSNKFYVTVKVYKQGVMGIVPIVLGGPAVYKIKTGETAEASLWLAAGLEKNLSNVTWSAGDSGVFSVVQGINLNGVLKGEKQGVATLTVTGDDFQNAYSALVVVGGDDDAFNSLKYMYVDNPYVTLIKGKSVTFKVNCTNLTPDEFNSLRIANNAPNRIEVLSYMNTVTIRGLEFGGGEAVISADGISPVVVNVRVVNYDLTPEMPYYLQPEKYIYGIVKGNSIDVPVDLVGGTVKDEKDIEWSIANENVATIKGNGKKCIVTAQGEGQTVLRVKHGKSNNGGSDDPVEIVIFVVLSDAELNSKIVIHVAEQNMMMSRGESRFVSIVTNARSDQNDFVWTNNNANVLGLRVNENRRSAFIDAAMSGSGTIAVKYGTQSPYVIYISVVDQISGAPYINVPSIVEMVKGESVTVNAKTSNISDIFNIKWKSAGENIVKAYGNGESCTLDAIAEGQTAVEIAYPDAANPAFRKNMVVYVYQDQSAMGSAYIFAADQGRYAINKGDVVSVGLVFGMRGYPEHDVTNIRWSTEDDRVIDVIGNGKTASVTGKAAGIAIIKVKDHYNNYVEIEIAVAEVGKVGKYAFSISQSDRLKGMLAGTDALIPVKVFNGPSEVFNVDGISYVSENPDIVRVERNDAGVKVFAQAGKEGQSYITISHDLVEDARILIYTSLTEGGLALAYPIMVEKTNYMAEKGESFSVKVHTINDDSNKLRNIEYTLEKNNGVLFIQERSKKELAVNAENLGSEVILVWYNAQIAQRVYVSVVNKGSGYDAAYLVTEGIIGMYLGQEYETRVDASSGVNINWKVDNENVCVLVDVEDDEGNLLARDKNAVLRAVGVGQATVTVKAGNIERYIAVHVVASEADLGSLNAVNIEQRKYQIPHGTELSVNIISYQGSVQGDTRFRDYYNYEVPYGNVVEVNKISNGKLGVKGVNVGTAAIRVTNEYYNADFVVYVEVYPVGGGGVTATGKDYYITMEKTLYVIALDNRDVYMQVSVMPQQFYGDYEWEWFGYDEEIVEVDFIGRSAVVQPKAEGQTIISVRNQMCENTLEITVIVGEAKAMESGKPAYIYVAKDIYEMYKGSSNLEVPYAIFNEDVIDTKRITFELSGGGIRVAHDVDNSVFKVEALNTGIARLDIKYKTLSKAVYILVKENLNAGNIYFTTNENFVIASIGELKYINIDLRGYEELDPGKIKWELAEGSTPNIVSLFGNGLVGQVYGMAEGAVTINISHVRNDEYKATYPLSINVKVVKDKAEEKIVYLTTQRNVVETVEGAASEMIYVQKVGGNAARSVTTWRVEDTSIVVVVANSSPNPAVPNVGGYSARLEVKKAGATRIYVKNEEADFELEIAVLVRESTGNNVFVTTSESLLWLSPGEKGYHISVSLENGDEKDYNKIVWTAQAQFPSEVVGGKVISIATSNNQCYIDALNVGVAEIRVEVPGKTNGALTITVYVSLYREIKFATSHKNVVIEEMEIVELELPTYERFKDKVKVWVESPVENHDGTKNPSNIVDVYYTNKLLLVHGRAIGSAVVKAAVEGKEGQAVMTVTVTTAPGPEVTRIIVGKNLYVFGFKHGLETLNAGLVGPEVYESDIDNIKWEIQENYNENNEAILDIIPKDLGETVKATGRTVQITPKSAGTAKIRVWHENITEGYDKIIYIVVAEDEAKFTVTPSGTVKVYKNREWVKLTADIPGGTNKDYEEVRWVAKMSSKWDGTMLEVVRIAGSGREVTLMPINNGSTEVYVFYGGGNPEIIQIECIADFTFEVPNRNEFMFPGEVRDVPYEIGPASNSVTWMNNNQDGSAPVITYMDLQASVPGGGSDSKAQRNLRITALSEGATSIIGLPSQGMPVTISVTVSNDYEFTVFNQKTGVVMLYDRNRPEPKYRVTEIRGGEVETAFKKDANNNPTNVPDESDGVLWASYTVCPSNAYIKYKGNIPSNKLLVEISEPISDIDSMGGTGRREVGRGTIKFTGLTEQFSTAEFQLYKPRSGDNEEPAPSKVTRPTMREIQVQYYFKDLELYPYFVRGDGKYSNNPNTVATAVPGTREAVTSKSNNLTIPGAEQISDENKPYMDLGDGEEHYILFDKKYENASVEITGLSSSRGQIEGSRERGGVIYTPPPEFGGNISTQFKAEIADFTTDGATYKGVRLSGGADFIDYSRVKFDKELIVEVESGYYKNPVEYVLPGFHSSISRTRNVYSYSTSAYTSGGSYPGYAKLRNLIGTDDYISHTETSQPAPGGGQILTITVKSYNGNYTFYGDDNISRTNLGPETVFLSIYKYEKSMIDDFYENKKLLKINNVMQSLTKRDPNALLVSITNNMINGNKIGVVSSDWPIPNDEYYYSLYNISYAKEFYTKYNVFQKKYWGMASGISGYVLNTAPSEGVYIDGLYTDPSPAYFNNMINNQPVDDRTHAPGIFPYFKYKNITAGEKVKIKGGSADGVDNADYGHGSSNGNSRTTSNINPNNGNFNIFLAYPREYRTWADVSVYHKPALDGKCYMDGRDCYGYTNTHTVTARQRFIWEDNGKSTITPYYILNRYPYRYQASTTATAGTQYAGINEGGGRPMPSIDRTIVNEASFTLYVWCRKLNIGNGEMEDFSIPIPIRCVVRKSHSQYMGASISDSEVFYNSENSELEGPINNYNNLSAHSSLTKHALFITNNGDNQNNRNQ